MLATSKVISFPEKMQHFTLFYQFICQRERDRRWEWGGVKERETGR